MVPVISLIWAWNDWKIHFKSKYDVYPISITFSTLTKTLYSSEKGVQTRLDSLALCHTNPCTLPPNGPTKIKSVQIPENSIFSVLDLFSQRIFVIFSNSVLTHPMSTLKISTVHKRPLSLNQPEKPLKFLNSEEVYQNQANLHKKAGCAAFNPNCIRKWNIFLFLIPYGGQLFFNHTFLLEITVKHTKICLKLFF